MYQEKSSDIIELENTDYFANDLCKLKFTINGNYTYIYALHYT